MNQLIFATSNEWKFNLAKDYFSKRGVTLEHEAIDLPESREEDVTKLAKEKARLAFSRIKKPLFVIDAALNIKALNDFPQTYIKFFEKYIRADGLLKLLEGEKNRRWEFKNTIGYKDATTEKCFVGRHGGIVVEELTHTEEGKIRDFDRILVPENYSKTFAEFTEEEWQEFYDNIWKPTTFDDFISWFGSRKW